MTSVVFRSADGALSYGKINIGMLSKGAGRLPLNYIGGEPKVLEQIRSKPFDPHVAYLRASKWKRVDLPADAPIKRPGNLIRVASDKES